MVTFTKFGSCVTSDIFNFMNISDYYPKHTHTGINIGTVVHKSEIPVLEKDIVAESSFGKECKNIVFNMNYLMII